MAKAGIDAIILTDQKNVGYLTGYQTLSWSYHARPVFAAISFDDVVVFGSLAEARTVDSQKRSFSARIYDGYLPEAVATIVVWGQEKVPYPRKIAVDYGQDFYGRGSLELIEALSGLSSDGKPVSAGPVLWNVRLIKSRFEADMKRIAFDIVNSAFDIAIASARLGMPEYELCQMVQAQTFLNGAETADPIAMLFSKGDFSYGRPASDRRLEAGHYIWTDFRATYGGYPADRNRIARAGEPAPWEVDVYTKVRALTVDLAASVKPGMSCADLYARFERMWADAELGPLYSKVSRIGHGGGLDVTEPPSISRADDTEIRPGMILHLEPKLERDGAVFQFEEVIFVTDTGSEFLSAISPETIPVVL
ncbi:M24 family metallopeptidase [Mesorhizobium sp. C268A]